MNSTPADEARQTRREFGLALGLAAATPLVASEPAAAAEEPAKAKPLTAAEALAALAEDRFGKHLTPEQLAEVRRSTARRAATSNALARFPLKNGDEPDFAFSPDVP